MIPSNPTTEKNTCKAENLVDIQHFDSKNLTGIFVYRLHNHFDTESDFNNVATFYQRNKYFIAATASALSVSKCLNENIAALI